MLPFRSLAWGVLAVALPLSGCGLSDKQNDDALLAKSELRQADAGSSGTVELSVTDNPNSVLSALATVSWSGPFVSLIVTVTSERSDRETPALSLSGVSSPVVIPILPLRAGTAYVLRATATDSTGATQESTAVTFTTGELPAGLPVFTVADGGTPSPGYTLVARLGPQGSVTDYVTIVNGAGTPVWYYQPPAQNLIGDFQQQPDGTFTLSLERNDGSGGYDYQQIDVMGEPVRSWTAVDAATGAPSLNFTGTDNHEVRLQPNGDALLFGNYAKTMDMTAYGGASNAALAGDVLERVTKSGDVTFSWNVFDYIDPTDADPALTSLTTSEIDLTHANSIDVMSDGNYLISLRNCSQVLKIDSTTGAVLWRLGGARGNFTFVNDPLGGFSGQHGARELPNGDILLFDDGDGHSPQQSRAVEYTLNTSASPMTATLVWSAGNPSLYTAAMGYAQRMPNGNTLVAYGLALHAQEVDSAGTVVWDLSEASGDGGFSFYRAYRLATLSPLALLPVTRKWER